MGRDLRGQVPHGRQILLASHARAVEAVALQQGGPALLQAQAQVMDAVAVGDLLAGADVAFGNEDHPGTLVDAHGVWGARMVEEERGGIDAGSNVFQGNPLARLEGTFNLTRERAWLADLLLLLTLIYSFLIYRV